MKNIYLKNPIPKFYTFNFIIYFKIIGEIYTRSIE